MAEQTNTPTTGAESQQPTEPEQPPGEYIMIPVAELAANPDNLREEITDVSGIAANLREDGAAGLIEPIVVVPNPDGGYVLRAGHRRLAAAVEAGTPSLPCLVRPDLAGKVAGIITGLRENEHRVGFTDAELVKGIEQLSLEGLSKTAIGKKTGFGRPKVKRAFAVAAMPQEARQAVAGLDLEQQATVAEFADDPEVVARLTRAAEDSPGAFKRRAIQERQEREFAAALAAHCAELTAAGVTVLKERPGYDGPAERLGSLIHDGDELTAENHTECPGHAAYVRQTYDGEITESYYCTDWKGHGHAQRYGQVTIGSTRGGAMTEEQKAERRAVIANNKALRAANEYRREWLRAWLARKSLPKGAGLYIAETLVQVSHLLGRWMSKGTTPMLAELLGETATDPYGRVTVKATTDARCHMYNLAVVAAAHESDISHDSWRTTAAPEAARWLAFLAEHGYDLSEIEQTIIDKAKAHKARRAAITTAEPQVEEQNDRAAGGAAAAIGGDEPDKSDTAEPSGEAAQAAALSATDDVEHHDPEAAEGSGLTEPSEGETAEEDSSTTDDLGTTPGLAPEVVGDDDSAVTRTGRTLSPEELDELVDEAERGDDVGPNNG